MTLTKSSVKRLERLLLERIEPEKWIMCDQYAGETTLEYNGKIYQSSEELKAEYGKVSLIIMTRWRTNDIR
jgi:hypothetical protein